MKTNHIAKTIVVSLFIVSAVYGSNALAGTKLKPPVVETTAEVVWYQPVLDFFTF